MKFSPSTGGFYDASIHGENMPDDVVEISKEDHAALLIGQSKGKLIIANQAGFPELIDLPKATIPEVWELIKIERDRRRFSGGVKVAEHWFKSDAIATSEYNSLDLLSSAFPENAVLRADWRTMDGSKVDMTPALVREILTAGFAAIAAIDDAAQAHKAALVASPDPADYDYSAGWPDIFEGLS